MGALHVLVCEIVQHGHALAGWPPRQPDQQPAVLLPLLQRLLAVGRQFIGIEKDRGTSARGLRASLERTPLDRPEALAAVRRLQLTLKTKLRVRTEVTVVRFAARAQLLRRRQ